jgi:hypothetical protein
MDNTVQKVLEMIITEPGQGNVMEKLDKKVRKLNRVKLYEMLEQIKSDFPVELYRYIPQVGKIQPAVLRFRLPKWRHYDEIFWQALGDYVILALRSVKDIKFNGQAAKLKIEYFATKKRHKSPEEITEIVKGLACLIDAESLSTDFTHFRRMAERRGSLGEMKKEQAALFGVALQMATSVAV